MIMTIELERVDQDLKPCCQTCKHLEWLGAGWNQCKHHEHLDVYEFDAYNQKCKEWEQ